MRELFRLEGAARLKYRLSRSASVEGSFLGRTYDLSAGFSRETSRYLVGAELSGRLGPGRAFTNARIVLEKQAYSTPGISIDREEDWLQWQAGYQVRPFGFSGSVDIGRARSRANRYDGSILRARLTTRAQPLKSLSIWATGEYATGYLVNASAEMQRWLLSLRTNLRVGRTEISATFYHNRIRTFSTQRSTSFKSLIRHSLASGHQISLQVQHTMLTGFSNTVGTDYRLAYLQPLGLPIGTRPPTESFLEGRIYDADSGLGLKNVLLFLGNSAAVSGDDGAFRIPTVEGATGYLRVDQKSVGYGRVSLVALPVEISPERENTNLLDIPVRLAAELDGSVDLYGSATGLPMLGQPRVQLQRVSGLGGLVLELRSAAARYRTRTSTDGSFSFQGVIPATYELEVISALPSRHRPETDSIRIELGPGQEVTRVLRVVPKRPTIQMMETEPALILSVPWSPVEQEAIVEPVPPASAEPGTDAGKATDPPASEAPESLRLDWDRAASQRLYALVVGSTPEERIAHVTMARYEYLGLPSTVLVEEIDGVDWFRTVVGQFRTAKDSGKVLQARAADLPTGSWVLRLHASR